MLDMGHSDKHICVNPLPPANANVMQIGGTHYRDLGDFQPWDTFYRWNLNPFAAHIIPYLVRWNKKATITAPAGSKEAKLEHLRKARHFLEKWIEEEERT